MELKNPRKKYTYSTFESNKWSAPLPIMKNDYKFKGFFNGFTVCLKNADDMAKLNSMGNFGKGNISRNHPTFNHVEHTKIIRERQLNYRKQWRGENVDQKLLKKVLVTPDSDDEDDDDTYFTDLIVKYDIDASGLTETLNLSLEEAFFLLNDVKCLIIEDEDSKEIMTNKEAWKQFYEIDKYFRINYLVYFYYRSRNWVVRPGIKFGGDFLLYKKGPIYYHASFVVVVDVLNEKLERNMDCRRSMEMKHLVGLNRLCETTGKELLICQVIIPDNKTMDEPEHIGASTIKEILLKRWLLKENKED